MSVFMLRQAAQSDPTGMMDEHLDAVEAESEALEARVAELEADPRMALTASDLRASAAYLGMFRDHDGANERRSAVIDVLEPKFRWVANRLDQYRAALAAEKGEGDG